ncbi:MAG: hypothetical protein ACMG55_09505 [Microcoleus sp.]
MSLDTLRHNGSEWKARATEAASQVSERGREVLQSPEAQRIAREIGGAALDGALDQVSKRGKDGERKLSVIKAARLLANPTGAVRRAATGAITEGRREARSQAFSTGREVMNNGLDQFRSNSTPPAIEASPDYSYPPSSSETSNFDYGDGFGNEAAPTLDTQTSSVDSWESPSPTQDSSPSVESSPKPSFRDRFTRKQEAAPIYASAETDDWGDKIVQAPAAVPIYTQESGRHNPFRKKEAAPVYVAPVSPPEGDW